MNIAEFSNGIAISKKCKELYGKRMLSYAKKCQHSKSIKRMATSTTRVT